MMGVFIKENGSTTFKTVTVRKDFLIKLSLLDNIKLEKSMVRGNLNGLMDQFMRENLGTVNFMVKEHIFGLMKGDILGSGLMVRWKV